MSRWIKQTTAGTTSIATTSTTDEYVIASKTGKVTAAKINSLSGDEFNRGIRAYYFGLAAVFWFVQPWVFAAITTVIVAVLFRRDFRSKTLAAMLP